MVTIYVEGGGDEASLKTQCRRAFTELLKNAGFKGKMPAVKAMGGRGATFDAFKTAHALRGTDGLMILLVDSETVPATNDAWTHLKLSDDWDKPVDATDDQPQLMVVCMETWLIADPDAMTSYFGREFKKSKLPTSDLEKRSKADIYQAIAEATSVAKPKGKYGKARDSFKLLSQIDTAKLRQSCIWANRFFETVKKYC